MHKLMRSADFVLENEWILCNSLPIPRFDAPQRPKPIPHMQEQPAFNSCKPGSASSRPSPRPSIKDVSPCLFECIVMVSVSAGGQMLVYPSNFPCLGVQEQVGRTVLCKKGHYRVCWGKDRIDTWWWYRRLLFNLWPRSAAETVPIGPDSSAGRLGAPGVRGQEIIPRRHANRPCCSRSGRSTSWRRRRRRPCYSQIGRSICCFLHCHRPCCSLIGHKRPSGSRREHRRPLCRESGE